MGSLAFATTYEQPFPLPHLLTNVAPNDLWHVAATRNVTSCRKTKCWMDGSATGRVTLVPAQQWVQTTAGHESESTEDAEQEQRHLPLLNIRPLVVTTLWGHMLPSAADCNNRTKWLRLFNDAVDATQYKYQWTWWKGHTRYQSCCNLNYTYCEHEMRKIAKISLKTAEF